ncbi:thioesterase II family protein [Streptomyces sp. NBC_00696]|uniref:thioesterase II family protein n=1 Tax=Streptomyces sp. NBC_00696 TaxID=2903672 RepID=UPI002E3689CE|nr:alpha/beta fold hydrolase [Streptomyces sp. NBC_00696]
MSATAATLDRWFLGPPPGPDAEAVLYCLPPAGAGATGYLGWRRHAPAGLHIQPVQPPGRENRITEPPDLSTDELAEALRRRTDRPYALYGHSMGGVVAHAVVQALVRSGAPLPSRLYVGAAPPPLSPMSWLGRWLDAGDSDLVRETAALGGTPDRVLAHARTRERLVRVLRSDLGWLAAHRPAVQPPLPVPLRGFAGDRDPLVGLDAMTGWRSFTDRSYVLRALRGGHFFHLEDPRTLARAVAADLRLTEEDL